MYDEGALYLVTNEQRFRFSLTLCRVVIRLLFPPGEPSPWLAHAQGSTEWA